MRGKPVIEKYLMLKMIKKYPNKSRYWIINKINELDSMGLAYISVSARTYNLFNFLISMGLIEAKGKGCYLNLFITDKGIKTLLDMELKISCILFSKNNKL